MFSKEKSSKTNDCENSDLRNPPKSITPMLKMLIQNSIIAFSRFGRRYNGFCTFQKTENTYEKPLFL